MAADPPGAAPVPEAPAANETVDRDQVNPVEAPRPPERQKETLHDSVDHFLGKVEKALTDQKEAELHELYEKTFNSLTEKHFKSVRWPHPDTVKAAIASKGEIFMALYKEMYFRHLMGLKGPKDLDIWKGSWENYCNIFDRMISDMVSQKPPSVFLPAQWTWDMLDEFVYHFQTYTQFRGKQVKSSKKDVIDQFKADIDVFRTTKLLTYLTDLVRFSCVEDYLKDPKNEAGRTGVAFTNEMVRRVGYFAIMQLLRVHSLLGDYHLAMKTIDCIDLKEEVPFFYKIPACHVTLYYYMGFAYLMMRRYADSIRTYCDILAFLSKTSGANSTSYQFEAIMKKQEQMYSLLLISLTLSPRPIDEALEKTIASKLGEKQARLQRGDEQAFEEFFTFACPKFVSAAPPDFDADSDTLCVEAHQRQLDLFQQELKQQQLLPQVASYMKLYTAIKMSKLAHLCGMDTERLRDQLLCVVHKTHQIVYTGGPPLQGESQLCSEVEFYVDRDMVHINSQRIGREPADVFLEQTLKFQDLLKKMGK